jgi:hypothetical protein
MGKGYTRAGGPGRGGGGSWDPSTPVCKDEGLRKGLR